jgi:lysophospholipase L1-like esterase
VLAIGSTLAALLVIELFIFYALDIKCPGYRPDRFLQFSPVFGQIHKANTQGWWYRYNDGSKFYVSINSYGFSDSERELKKTRPRIALIGDSTTEFWEADPEGRGQRVIENLLGGRYEVLNFGVRGYGTDQTYLLFTDIGVCFSPDIVVYTFCVNDITNNSYTRSKPYYVSHPDQPDRLLLRGYPVKMQTTGGIDRPTMRSIDRFLRAKSFIYRKMRGLTMSAIGYAHPLEGHFELRPFKRLYDDEDSRRMKITLKVVSMLKDYVEENGMKFLLVEGIYRAAIDPEMQKTLVGKYGDVFDFDRVTRSLDDYALSKDIEFVSLPRLAKEQGLRASDLMHSEDNMHLDRRGIVFFSDAVVQKLNTLGWLTPISRGSGLAF